MRTSGETNTPASWLAQFAQGRLRSGWGEEEKKHIKRGAKIGPPSSLCVFWAGLPSHLEDVFSFACPIKLSCDRAVTLV